MYGYIHNNMDETQKHHAERKKLDIKDYILYGFTYVKYCKINLE